MTMPLSGADHDKAVSLLQALRAEKYQAKNYLFLAPFDVAQVPGYVETVGGPPLDLQTIELRLDAYDSFEAVVDDIQRCFDNAIRYHGDKPTKWIAKMARDMVKTLHKERKLMEQPRFSASNAVLPDTAPTSLSSTTTEPTATTAAAPTAKHPNTAKTPTISLKLTSSSSSATAAAPIKKEEKTKDKPVVVKAKPTQPKLKLKISMSSGGGGGGGATSNTKPASSAQVHKDSTNRKPNKITIKSSSAPRPPFPEATAAAAAATPPPASRGKELPKGVVAEVAPTKTATTSKKKKLPKATTATATNAGATSTSSTTAHGGLTARQITQCYKVVLGLKRKHHKNISWFLSPISDKSILKDYKMKIKHPMDLGTLTSRLLGSKKSYASVALFVLDVRRVFANCLKYNTSIKDSLRQLAVEMLETTEQLLAAHVYQSVSCQPSSSSNSSHNNKSPYPTLLFCWKLCVGVLDTLYNLVNPDDGQPTALYFWHPVSYYCGGQFPADYLAAVGTPMDFGTVTSNLLEGKYAAVEDFGRDCRLVVSNCVTYYGGRDDGKVYVQHAQRLETVLQQQLDGLARYMKSSKGQSDRAAATAFYDTFRLPSPPSTLYLSVLDDLRALQYTDKATRITEPAMGPFEKPVSLQVYPDYHEHITDPIDLGVIERKAMSLYQTPEDFDYDMHVLFRNCEHFHGPRPHGDHLVSMAKFGARKYRQIFYAKMRGFEDPSSLTPPPKEIMSDAATRLWADKVSSGGGGLPSKKLKIDVKSGVGGKVAPGSVASPTGAAAPRINISMSAAVANAASSMSRAKSPKTLLPTSGAATAAPKRNVPPLEKSNTAPVPLHIAIARVKEAFPMRRNHKSLQSWESDCARYFKELMRHPWLSAARPKFIFHVPVPDLFPELREVYAAKIRKPMDLTTVECSLLVGNRYAGPEDFCHDVALVFANAIRFNKDGRDIGDPLSCAYYDASVHLLRYSRWLSMEILAEHMYKSLDVDLAGADGLPPFSWRLTTANQKQARDEMEQLVLKEPIEKSLEGDRWTWYEAECEKLLKSLRHQSDLKHMQYFLTPNYPADYMAFIARPMDWEKVQRTLKKRQYDRFGDVIDQLRLIFSNALKYNERHRGTDTVSGRAFAAAQMMSDKLETAINKLLLSVSDRLERERIDHANAEREIEAAEQAEEAAIRAAWKKEDAGGDDDDDDIAQKKLTMPATASSSSATAAAAAAGESSQHHRIRIAKRMLAQNKRDVTDFEMPFFDDEEDYGQHERSYFELVKYQKNMFEKQRQELGTMRQAAATIGGLVFHNILQQQQAEAWVERERPRAIVSKVEKLAASAAAEPMNKGARETKLPSHVLSDLENAERDKVRLLFKTTKKQRRRRTNAFGSSDDEEDE